MPYLMLQKLPQYECIQALARQYPELDPASADAFLHLLRAADELFSARELSLGKFNLSCGRFAVMMQLFDKETDTPIARTPAELATVAGVTRATMTGLVDTLERDGLVKREPDPTDRRMMSVNLTQKGHQLITQVLPNHFRLMGEVMSPLAEAERKTLVRLLAKILQPRNAAVGLDLDAKVSE